MKKTYSMALGAILLCTPVAGFAQSVQPTAQEAVQQAALTIPAGLSIPLSLNSGISTSRNREGETVGLTVVNDVISDGVVVIPRGTRAVGEISMRSGRGSFGKSGKVEIAFRYLDMDGIRVPLEGSYFQAGDGNTAGTVGAVLGAGVIGGLVVTGHSANIAQGHEFTARTLDAIPVVVQAAASSADRPHARLASNYTPSSIQTGSPRRIEQQRIAAEARAARRQRTRSASR